MLCDKCKKPIETRTSTQNRALHLFFTELADLLNEKGLYMDDIIQIELEWTPESIKKRLWKPLQKALFNKQSTTKLNKGQEINKIYDNLNKILIERTNGEVELRPFPSNEFKNK